MEEEDPREKVEAMRKLLGPGAVERQLQEVISICWMTLPPENQTLESLEFELRRIFERAIANLREDDARFNRKGG